METGNIEGTFFISKFDGMTEFPVEELSKEMKEMEEDGVNDIIAHCSCINKFSFKDLVVVESWDEDVNEIDENIVRQQVKEAVESILPVEFIQEEELWGSPGENDGMNFFVKSLKTGDCLLVSSSCGFMNNNNTIVDEIRKMLLSS